MPKRGGRRGGRRRKAEGDNELLIKEDGEEYGQIVKVLGGGTWELQCMDDVKRIGKLRGKLRRRCRLQIHDLVLVCLREGDTIKCDITHRYTNAEAKELQMMGEIPNVIDITKIVDQKDDIDIEFENEAEKNAQDKDKDKDKPKVKTNKQNLNDFMPGSDSESDEEEDKKPAKPKQEPAKPVKIQGTTREVKQHDSDEGSEEEGSEKGSSEESDREHDPLADI